MALPAHNFPSVVGYQTLISVATADLPHFGLLVRMHLWFHLEIADKHVPSRHDEALKIVPVANNGNIHPVFPINR